MQRLPHQHHKNHKPSGVSFRCQHPRMALDICGGSGDPAGLPAACSLPFAYISSFSIIFSLSPLTPSYFLFLFPLLSTFMSTFLVGCQMLSDSGGSLGFLVPLFPVAFPIHVPFLASYRICFSLPLSLSRSLSRSPPLPAGLPPCRTTWQRPARVRGLSLVFPFHSPLPFARPFALLPFPALPVPIPRIS